MANYPAPTTNATMAEKAEIIKSEHRHTFQSRAIAEADDVRGRWAEINKSNVVGATPTPVYPAGPNWAADPVGVEPALGFSVEAHEPVGEVGEVQASIEALGDATEAVVGQSQSSPVAGAKQHPPASMIPRSAGGAAAPTAVGASPAMVGAPAIPNPKPKPRGV